MNLDDFNPEQKEAVTLSHKTEDLKKILLIAGAGSGKTRVLVHRIYYLVKKCKVPSKNILALTFTKKAALEMRTRTLALIGERQRVKMSTFHSLAADLLRAFGQSKVEIIDDNDKDKMLRLLTGHMRAETGQEIELRKFKSWLGLNRNKGVDPEKAEPGDSSYVAGFRVLARKYREMKAQMHVMDFDDLLEKTVAMLESNSPLVDTLRTQWPYVMVDEYQDTNRVQFRFLNLLCGENTQLLQVGDEDQLIYSWRGAEIEHILKSYRDSFNSKKTKCIVLNRNYRCAGNILTLANEVIGQNALRAGKSLVAHKGRGLPVKISIHEDCKSEAEAIAQQITRWHAQGTPFDRMATLFRTNRMSRELESAMIAEGIPYKLHNGTALFDTKESQLLMALLRFTERPDESFFLRDIFAQIKHGIGPATIDKEDEDRRESGVDWVAHIKSSAALMKKKRVSELVMFYEGAKELLNAGDLVGAAQYWFYHWDLTQFYKEETREKRAITLTHLLAVIENYVHDAVLRDVTPTVLDFQEQRMLNDVLLDGEKKDEVNLMTVHKAKGLEFKCGVIVGMQDGVFPKEASEFSSGNEEDFRIAYVAITRFEEELVLTRARYRTGFNRISTYSSLLDEQADSLIEEKVLDYVDSGRIDTKAL
ncbi:ATP-dependent helicase [Alteromonas sp. 14N.309.X.WAT.G.H12]|uniref:ATP-dependent helicase n=1 Tax=Alteromonas sp. 14N.309.X.WAT.G.H12 TaxID=3120824 RepID=UPI002FCF377D